MITAVINNKNYAVEFDDDSQDKGHINSVAFEVVEVTDNTGACVSLHRNHVPYTVEIVESGADKKICLVKINGRLYEVAIRDEQDLLLESLGWNKANVELVREVRAPMPGMVLDIRVSSGDRVKKGDPLLVLEAMKMENLIKSPCDGVIGKCSVNKGRTVEKNEILVSFEKQSMDNKN